MNYITDLQKAITHLHGCKAEHVASVPVVEKLRDKVVWEGHVEVFDITGHKTAKRCYAWSHTEDGKTVYSTYLHCEPITTPIQAVKAFIESQNRSH